jgi:hypothetical protein
MLSWNNVALPALHLNEPSQRPGEILKTRFIREGSDAVFELLVPALHEILCAARIDARSKVACLMGKRIHNELSLFARERSDLCCVRSYVA